YIIEAARLAPTSSGLQPFKIIEIRNDELKQQILPIAFNQQQIVDSSHLLVFAAYDEFTEERISYPFKLQQIERELALDFAEDYKNSLISRYSALSKENHFEHAARQAYIGFGIAIAAAAEKRVDATPMEGFDNNALDKLLGLNELGLRSVTILPLGYRDEENDWLVNLKKVRLATADFLINKN